MKYSILFRVWHWLNAFVVLGLLGTVFLRKTFLSWRTNSEILMNKLAEFGVDITVEQAKILAKAVRAGMWEWHIIFGYVLVFSVVLRIYIYFKENPIEENFNTLNLHKKAVRIFYYLFYLTLFFMTISGLVLHFYEFLTLSKALAGILKDIHELVFNFILFFVVTHVLGVFFAEFTQEKGLVNSMLHGNKKTQ